MEFILSVLLCFNFFISTSRYSSFLLPYSPCFISHLMQQLIYFILNSKKANRNFKETLCIKYFHMSIIISSTTEGYLLPEVLSEWWCYPLCPPSELSEHQEFQIGSQICPLKQKSAEKCGNREQNSKHQV